MRDTKYWIKYKSECGNFVFKLLPLPCDKATAENVLAGAKAMRPDIDHWIEPATSDTVTADKKALP